MLGRVWGERTIVLSVRRARGVLRPKLVTLGKTPPAPDVSRCSAAAAKRVARCLGPLIYQQVTGRSHQPAGATATTTAKPVYKRWWFWALVAGGVAGAAGATAGIYYATQPTGANIDLQLD